MSFPKSVQRRLAKRLPFHTEAGWSGLMCRQDNCHAMYRVGHRIAKVAGEPKDATPLGMQGTVLGSVYVPGLGCAYFIEWDDKPRVSVFVVEWKIDSADSGDCEHGAKL